MYFLRQLKRRSVIRAALIYVIVAWFALQGVDLMIESLDAPAWLSRVVLISLIVCFPIVLMLAWATALTSGVVENEES